MNKGIFLTTAAALSLLIASVTYATPVEYFGLDENPGNTTTNSDSAHSQFLSFLSGVGTEDFDSFADGQSNITLAFPGSLSSTITATLNGNGSTTSGNNSGAVAHSSPEYYLVITASGGTNEFNIDFDTPISAFGFYGSDISDSGSQLFLTLTDSGGATHSLQVTSNASHNSSNQLFYGFIDTSLTYTNISFTSDSGGDFFGFDDMIVGDVGQITGNPNAVPEPGALGILGLGLLGMIALLALRRRID